MGLPPASFAAKRPAGAVLANPKLPGNINYVWGFSDAAPQTWMNPKLCLLVWMAALVAFAYAPIHHLLKRWSKAEG